MLFTVLILFVVALALTVVLWAGSLWFQSAIYSEPVREPLLAAPRPWASA